MYSQYMYYVLENLILFHERNHYFINLFKRIICDDIVWDACCLCPNSTLRKCSQMLKTRSFLQLVNVPPVQRIEEKTIIIITFNSYNQNKISFFPTCFCCNHISDNKIVSNSIDSVLFAKKRKFWLSLVSKKNNDDNLHYKALYITSSDTTCFQQLALIGHITGLVVYLAIISQLALIRTREARVEMVDNNNFAYITLSQAFE